MIQNLNEFESDSGWSNNYHCDLCCKTLEYTVYTGRKSFKTHHRALSWCPNNLAFAEKVAWKAVLIAKLFELHLFCRLWEQPENQFVICTYYKGQLISKCLFQVCIQFF